jgi:hypothetical protein
VRAHRRRRTVERQTCVFVERHGLGYCS